MTAAVRPLTVGDLIRDNDPRMAARDIFGVDQINGSKVVASFDPFSSINIAVSRIHLDGKPRRSGWSRVTA